MSLMNYEYFDRYANANVAAIVGSMAERLARFSLSRRLFFFSSGLRVFGARAAADGQILVMMKKCAQEMQK